MTVSQHRSFTVKPFAGQTQTSKVFVGGHGTSELADQGHRGAESASAAFAGRYLRADASEELIAYYAREQPIEASVSGTTIRLPFSCVVAPRGRGDCDEQGIEFSLAADPFSPPAALQSYTRQIKGSVAGLGFYNGDVVRLSHVHSHAGRTVIALNRARYFDALATNFAMDHTPVGVALSLRDHLHSRTKRLTPFADDVIVNHIGIVCIIATADGKLIVQRRSSDVANRPGTRSSSASGALDYGDISSCATNGRVTLESIAHAGSREIEEELGFRVPELKFLGLYREFLRGGKPEMYFFGTSTFSWAETEDFWRGARDRAESTAIEPLEFHGARLLATEAASVAAARIDAQVSRALDRISGSANSTLVTGILLAADHVKRQLSYSG